MSGIPSPLDRLRAVCAPLPESVEGVSVHHPSFKVRGKSFVMYVDTRGPELWIKATAEDQSELVASAPDRFFKPPYLGPRGWVGMRLADADWTEVAELVTDGYRLAAPRRLVRELDAGGPAAGT
ncbi:MmcQ/YjbR family DNA-binding protein [Streptomyces durbertensis]|uniref:MmcQ/YjbR family DNA-binding protein n=1 Tax=Streptomyces durbertensis TaxID=2448886 RepID=A0ABR6ELI7_9ACTN|nr:MmcQ/YjbR family DNA-binding protein [Streptomyces durbertensis]MBB1246185.1 MmcQ/YjbR family DNA-binding protein [Streptomyces durbertensis]